VGPRGSCQLDEAQDPNSSAWPDTGDFAAFAGHHPALLDKRLLTRFYRASTLASPAARAGWVEPDLTPFPWT
jgi:hypothetical protein